jgi:hypothetical protein
MESLYVDRAIRRALALDDRRKHFSEERDSLRRKITTPSDDSMRAHFRCDEAGGGGGFVPAADGALLTAGL